jgi:SNF2 family DNA or RNA helicase
MSKVDAAVKIVEDNPGGKFIIFSNHYRSFYDLGVALRKKNVTNQVLMGSSHQQNNTIAQFKAGELRVIMLNTCHSGSGIDLHCATDLIIYQKLKTEIQTQVIGRADRPGRTSGLHVHHLLHSNELNLQDNSELIVMR